MRGKKSCKLETTAAVHFGYDSIWTLQVIGCRFVSCKKPDLRPGDIVKSCKYTYAIFLEQSILRLYLHKWRKRLCICMIKICKTLMKRSTRRNIFGVPFLNVVSSYKPQISLIWIYGTVTHPPTYISTIYSLATDTDLLKFLLNECYMCLSWTTKCILIHDNNVRRLLLRSISPILQFTTAVNTISHCSREMPLLMCIFDLRKIFHFSRLRRIEARPFLKMWGHFVLMITSTDETMLWKIFRLIIYYNISLDVKKSVSICIM